MPLNGPSSFALANGPDSVEDPATSTAPCKRCERFCYSTVTSPLHSEQDHIDRTVTDRSLDHPPECMPSDCDLRHSFSVIDLFELEVQAEDTLMPVSHVIPTLKI